MFAYDERGERATRDIVSRAIEDRIRKGRARRTAASGSRWAHLGPDNVRRELQGHGRALRRLRLRPRRRPGRGGADRALHDGRRRVRRRLRDTDARGSSPPARTPAACTARTGSAATASRTRPCSAGSPATPWRRSCGRIGAHADPDPAAIEAALERVEAPFRRRRRRPQRDPRAPLRRDVGRCRHPAHGRRPARAASPLSTSSIAPSTATGVADGDRAFNLTWHDWLNLKNLVLVSRSRSPPRRSRARIRAAPISARISPRRASSRRRATRWRGSTEGASRSRPSRCISRA